MAELLLSLSMISANPTAPSLPSHRSPRDSVSISQLCNPREPVPITSSNCSQFSFGSSASLLFQTQSSHSSAFWTLPPISSLTDTLPLHPSPHNSPLRSPSLSLSPCSSPSLSPSPPFIKDSDSTDAVPRSSSSRLGPTKSKSRSAPSSPVLVGISKNSQSRGQPLSKRQQAQIQQQLLLQQHEQQQQQQLDELETALNSQISPAFIPPLPSAARKWPILKREEANKQICRRIVQLLPPVGASTARSFIYRGGLVNHCKGSTSLLDAHLRFMHEKGLLVVRDGKELGERGVRLTRSSNPVLLTTGQPNHCQDPETIALRVKVEALSIEVCRLKQFIRDHHLSIP